MQTALCLQVYKMCWICLISSIKGKWGTSHYPCRAQHNEARLHTLNLKHQWNSSDAFSSAHVCTVWWITSTTTIQWILCCLRPSTELAFLAGQPSLIQSSLKSMETLSTIDRITLIRSQDRKLWGNIRATLFVALNICLVFWNLLTKAAWKKPGSQRLLPSCVILVVSELLK